jgi:hypothetical protein
MRTSTLSALTRLFILNLILNLACAATATVNAVGEETRGLPALNAAIEETSISGISSGGYMAVQFGTAWSSIVKGVGVVAGGPFYCAQATASDFWTGYTLPVLIATGKCMRARAQSQRPRRRSR